MQPGDVYATWADISLMKSLTVLNQGQIYMRGCKSLLHGIKVSMAGTIIKFYHKVELLTFTLSKIVR